MKRLWILCLLWILAPPIVGSISLKTPNQTRIDLIEPFGYLQHTQHISKDGQFIAGYCDINTPARIAYHGWKGDAQDFYRLQDLTPDAQLAEAFAVNSAGHVVGQRDGHAFYYDGNQTRLLPELNGGQSSSAKGIDDFDNIVGDSSDGDGVGRGVLWQPPDYQPIQLDKLVDPSQQVARIVHANAISRGENPCISGKPTIRIIGELYLRNANGQHGYVLTIQL